MKIKLCAFSCFIIFMMSPIILLGQQDQTNKIDLTKQKWFGNAICYSGYRERQNPDSSKYPTQAQILEDMKILEKHFTLIRTYGSDQHSKDILEVIRREKIHLSVMLGAWLSAEPGNEATNAKQIAQCIELANTYKDIVVAVSVGNEILVDWSNHKLPEAKVIQYIKQVKAAVSVPVTVDDDFMFWLNNGTNLAKEVDFIAMHVYPMWAKHDIDSGFAVTKRLFEAVRAKFPGKTVHIGEAGWASYSEGKYHAPKAGDEIKQKRYFDEVNAWAQKDSLTIFIFEAFDEPWKGTGTEGHWGLFSVGRKAKLVMHQWYPELVSNQPTSPSYDEKK